MDLKAIIDDILTDAKINEDKFQKSQRENFSLRRKVGGGYFLMVIPHIIGYVIGFFLSMQFDMGNAGAIFIGTIIALIFGTAKSVMKDCIALAPAIVRNIILVAALLVFALILSFLSKLTNN